MITEEVRPRIDTREKYGISLLTESGILFLIQSYGSLEQLKESYTSWRQYASNKGVTLPVPIELLDDKGGCKILTDIIQSTQD